MKEDLGFHGNELVQLQTLYIVGAVVGQLPFLFLFTYVPLNILIPFMDVCWGIFTLLQFRVTGFAEIAAYRFLVGFFEVSCPPTESVTRYHIKATIDSFTHAYLPP